MADTGGATKRFFFPFKVEKIKYFDCLSKGREIKAVGAR